MIDPTSSRTEGYHLFLEPSGILRERVCRIISDLAKELDGPVFVPHITLLARIPEAEKRQLKEKAQALASQLQPVILTLEEVRKEDRYFRALYLKIAETQELTKWHARAAEVFSVEADASYVPHMSLFYGLRHEADKESAHRDMDLPVGEKMHIDRIHLYRTQGEATEWEKVAEFPLS